MSDYMICVRDKKSEKNFGNDPGTTHFLKVPKKKSPEPCQSISRKKWNREVLDKAKTGVNEVTKKNTGDILVFIHGYNNSQEIVLKRHRKLQSNLKEAGYKGAVISYDWPSAQSALNYLEDRDDAKNTARRLRDDCISLFLDQQETGCEINIHLLGHSTGAYVIRHAFTEADEKASLKNCPWTVSQIVLIGGDISSRSMSVDDNKSTSLYRHCIRLTNYQNPFDSVLKLSNTKRIGLAPRVGRVGLPDNSDKKAINVNCGEYYARLNEAELTEGIDYYGTFQHSWHIGDKTFAKDLALTLAGDIDRYKIPTRRVDDGEVVLCSPQS